MNKTYYLAMALLAIGSGLAGCGGGGAGPGVNMSPPISPPPPPPPPTTVGVGNNDCATKPNSLACKSGVQNLIGAVASITRDSQNRLSSSTIYGGVSNFPNMTMNAGSAGTAGDEVYQWKEISGNQQTFSTGAAFSTPTIVHGFTTYKYGCTGTGCTPFDLYLINLQSANTGTPDYAIPTIFEQGATRSYGTYGLLSGAFTSGMQVGTGTYQGFTIGEMNGRDQTVWQTKSDFSLVVNFASGVINGSASHFQGYAGTSLTAPGTYTTLPDIPDFDFSTFVSTSDGSFSGNATGSATGSALTGQIRGHFYGEAGKTPDEVGFSYFLSSSGPIMAMVGTGGASLSALELPTPQAPLSPLQTDCVHASCVTTPTTYYGPSALITVTNANPGVANPVARARIDNTLSGVNVTVSPGATSFTSDDVYTVAYIANGVNYTQTFTGFIADEDGLGGKAKLAYGTQNGYGASLLVFDLSSSLSNTLDFVQLAAYDRTVSAIAAEDAFFVFGRQTLPADMPTNGSAQYAGATRGIYVTGDTGVLYRTASDVTLNANFASGAVSGLASNFKFMNGNGLLVARSEKLDFIYSGTIASGTSQFSGTAISTLPGSAGGMGLTGAVQGAFFGAPGQSPEEAGFTYSLGVATNGPFMMGGAALGKKP